MKKQHVLFIMVILFTGVLLSARQVGAVIATRELVAGSEARMGSKIGVVVNLETLVYENEAVSVKAEIPTIIGLPDPVVQDGWNTSTTQEISQFIQEIEELGKEALEESVGQPWSFLTYEAHTVVDTKLAEGYGLSVTVLYYQYTGGAHGISFRKSTTFNLDSGKVLGLEDFFLEGYDYVAAINEFITEAIQANPEYYFSNDWGFKTIGNDQPFYVDSEDLVIYFGLYEIAPYASGFPEFRIPFSYFENNMALPK